MTVPPTSPPATYGEEFLDWLGAATEHFWRSVDEWTLVDFRRNGFIGPRWRRGTRWTGGMTEHGVAAMEHEFGRSFPPEHRLFLRRLHSTIPWQYGADYRDGELGLYEAPGFYAADPDAFFLRGAADLFAPEALAEYRAAYTRPEVVHAMCQDYRAAATVDVADDEADRGRRTIACPTLVLWGRHSPLGGTGDILDTWRAWAPDVRGHPLHCGHYLAEERPKETLQALRDFLGASGTARPASGAYGSV